MYKVKVISLKRRNDRRIKMAHLLQNVPFEFVDALDTNLRLKLIACSNQSIL